MELLFRKEFSHAGMKKIIFINNNEKLLSDISKCMERDIHIKNIVKSKDNIEILTDNTYDLLLINTHTCDDWTLVVSLIRNKSKIPIIIYADEAQFVDVVTAFRLGADDYVTKQQTSIEMTLRIKNLISRYREREPDVGKKEHVITFGNISLHPAKHIVLKDMKPVELTKTEFDMLYFLARHKGMVLSKTQICHGVWNDEFR